MWNGGSNMSLIGDLSKGASELTGAVVGTVLDAVGLDEGYKRPDVEVRDFKPKQSLSIESTGSIKSSIDAPPEVQYEPDEEDDIQDLLSLWSQPRETSLFSTGLEGMAISYDDDPEDEVEAPTPTPSQGVMEEQDPNGDIPVSPDESETQDAVIQHIKQRENNLSGMTNGRFMPYEDEGTNSPYGKSIGYGTQIKEGWLGDDPLKWAKINGQPFDIRNGITEDQATAFVNQEVELINKNFSDTVKGWDNLVPPVQGYFTDLAYNGGRAVLDKNSKALEALEKGNAIDAMLGTFDFWNVKGKPSEDLFKRRIEAYNKVATTMRLPRVVSYNWGDGKASANFSSPFDIATEKYLGKKKANYQSKKIEGESKQVNL